jgi:hypothetical protein
MDVSIQKQLIINQIGEKLNLPYEITDIIKSLNFYDIKTYNLIRKAKLYKAEINHIIRNVLVFYNYNYIQNPNYNRWGILLYSLDDTNPFIHINNDVCNHCGNYCGNYFDNEINNNIPRNIICKCPFL